MHQYLTSPPHQTPLEETYSTERSPIPPYLDVRDTCKGERPRWKGGDEMGKEKGMEGEGKERELGRGVLWSTKNL